MLLAMTSDAAPTDPPLTDAAPTDPAQPDPTPPPLATRPDSALPDVGLATAGLADVVLPTCDLKRMCEQRLARLRAEMADQNVDAAVLMHGPNVTYATGFVPDAVDASHVTYQRAVAIVTQDCVRLHAHTRTAGLECETGSALWPELDDGIGAMRSALQETVGDLAGRQITVDAVTGAMARAGLFNGARIVDANRVLGAARLVKTEDEIACIERSQILTERAMEPARRACVVGATRRDVAGTFLAALRSFGGDHNKIDPIFQPMPRAQRDGPCTSSGAIAFPTGVGDPTYRTGDLVWVDSGHGYQGYASDYGRTWIVGREPNSAEHSCFDRWLTVTRACCEAIKPGVTLGDVAREAIAANDGTRPWLPYFYVAHGVGLESAEMPMIGTDLGDEFDDNFVLAPGMILVLEPVIWEDGVAGYRAEEIVVVTDDGHRILSSFPGYAPFES